MASTELLDQQYHEDITLDELLMLDDPCVVFQRSGTDSDGVGYFCYTVGGFLHGRRIGGPEGGALVGGDTIIVNATRRGDADDMAYHGLMQTIAAERQNRVKSAQIDKTRNLGIIADVTANKH